MLPLVSIICITYNHARFIRDALEGFVNQKTSFSYEAIVHDDASVDGTAEIVKAYAQKYPDIIVPILEEENQFQKGGRTTRRLMLEVARGKYLAVCEGDDFWTDPEKLQKQVEYMEMHPDCSMYIHNGDMLDQETGVRTRIDPYPKSSALTAADVIEERGALPPTASMLFRRADILKMPEFFWNAPVGDRPRRLYCILKGYIYYSDAVMCVYRANVKGSFSNRVKTSSNYRSNCFNRMIDFFDQYDAYTEGKYTKEIAYAKSREEFDYSLRCGDRRSASKTMYFHMAFTPVRRLRWHIVSYIPSGMLFWLKKVRDKMKRPNREL